MASVVLALTNHAFTPSIWSAWASAPFDLVLATEDGSIGAHCGLLLPLSHYLATVIEAQTFTGQSQVVVLVNTSIKAVAAVKELIYTGSCFLDNSMQPEESIAEILETLSVLGIEVSLNSFSLETEFLKAGESVSPNSASKSQRSRDVLEDVKEEIEDVDVVNQFKINGKSEDIGKVSMLSTGFEQIWKQEIKVENNVKEELQIGNLEVKIKEEFCVEKNVHIKKRVFVCNFEGCKAKLSSKDSLKGHIRYVHKKKKLLECNQCKKKFTKSYNLQRHTDAVHAKLKPYQCEEAGCSTTFGDKDSLNYHIKTFHLKEKPFACLQPGCGEKFGVKINLKRHMMKAHNFEKPHSCVEKNCEQKFEERRQLSNHLRIVHGAEKLTCDIDGCASTFLSLSGLHRHKKKHTETN